MSEVINNEFGVEEVAVNPQELKEALNHFNWGVFGFGWLWGLGNGCFNKTWPIIIVQVLMYIPLVNILALVGWLGLSIYFGLNGNKWAYAGRAWWSLTDFTMTQRRWATAFIVILSLILFGILLYIFGFATMYALLGGAGR